MATFFETANEVVNGKGTKQSKVNALVELGMMRQEAEMFYEIHHEGVSIRHRASFDYTFGVEIECLVKQNLTFDKFRSYNVPYEYNNRYYHSNGNSIFQFKRDGSLVCGLCNYSPLELVSPVLKSQGGFAQLEQACKALNSADAKVNRSCGLHVHIGAAGLSVEQYTNVFRNYQMLESVIDSFMAPSRRENRNTYCASLKDIKLDNVTSHEEVEMAFGFDRYHKVNAMSWDSHNTIEFRQHQGTTDYAKIKNWVTFCAKLVEFSKSNLITSQVTSVDQIPFLTKTEKKYFNNRVEALRNR